MLRTKGFGVKARVGGKSRTQMVLDLLAQAEQAPVGAPEMPPSGLAAIPR